MYGIFGRKITKYTVIYGVYIQFWPTLHTALLRMPEGHPRPNSKERKPHVDLPWEDLAGSFFRPCLLLLISVSYPEGRCHRSRLLKII